MRTRVEAPAVATIRNNLLASAREINIPGERWNIEGIAYIPHHYRSGYVYDPTCGVEADLENGTSGIQGEVQWDPVEIYWAERCLGPQVIDFTELPARARRNLDVHRSDLIENLLWTNEANGVDVGLTHPNVGLAHPNADILNGGNPVGPVTAISLLAGALSSQLRGVRGMIHVPGRVLHALPFLDFYGLSVVAGNQLAPGSLDHMLVAGSGYPGTGPNGVLPGSGYTWFYATSQVDVRLGPVFVPEGGFLHTENLLEIRAQQPVLVSWDQAAHYAVQVCLTDPAPDCAPEGS